MSSATRVRLGDVVKIEKAPAPQGDSVWLLNLDAVEKDTGRLLGKNFVARDEIGNSTVPFSSDAVLYSKLRPNLNKVVLPDSCGYATSEMLPLVPDSEVLDRRYLAAFLRSKDFVAYAVSSTAGSKMPRVNKKTVLVAEMGLPELAVQMERVQLLGALEERVDVARRQLVELDNLVKSRFIEMFGDPDSNRHGLAVQSLGEVLVVQPSNGLYKPQKDYVTDGTGIPIIRIDSFSSEGPDFSSLKRLTCSEAERSRYGIAENDIVINRVNSVGCMGKTMLIARVPEPTVYESNMMRLHSNEDIMLPAFLCAQMTSDYSKNYFESNAKRAIGQASINQKDVKGLPVFLPPLDVQERYLAFARQVDKARAIARQQVAKLQLLYDSLAQDYFGE